MDFKRENTDRIFREGLKNFEVTPPPEVWEGVMEAFTRKKKRVSLFYRYAAAAVALLLVVGSLYTLVISDRKPGESEIRYTRDEQTGVQKNLQKEVIVKSGNITTNIKSEIITTETVEQESVVTESILAATIQTKKFVKTESESLFTDDNLLQTEVPVDIRNNANVLLQEENYDLLEIRFLASFLEKTASSVNSELVYREKKFPVSAAFVTEPAGNELKSQGNWSFGVKFSPVYASRNITMSKPGNFIEMYNDVEKGIFAFTGGFDFKYNPAGRLSFHTGLFYSRMGQRVTDFVAYIVPPYIASTLPGKGPNRIVLNTSFGTVMTSETELYVEDKTVSRVENRYSIDDFDPVKAGLKGYNAEIVQNFDFLEVPLLLSYKVIDRGIDIQLLGGISTNLLVGNNVFTEFDGKRISLGETSGIYKFSYSSIVGFGVEYGFTDHLIFSIEPTFKYYLNSLSSGTRLHVHPFSVGLFSGVSYKF
ncbi:MAG: hypothetical protein IIB05_03770 [Bacteroidetes bacterium]|nr:hypothetical protein [Bacteroidota bacterium]